MELNDFQQHLMHTQLLPAHSRILVAVSTGVDSMALLQLLQRLSKAWDYQLQVVHVNHELRTQSIEEEAFLRTYCEKNQLPVHIKHWPKSQHPLAGIEAAARQFRYAFFEEVFVQTHSDYLVTAHHSDDQAETVLMRLAKTGNLGGMVGIKPVRPFANGKLVRPLLPFSKQELHDYAMTQRLTYYQDATNASLEMSRNRIRHQVLPRLKQENPQILAHVQQFTTSLQAALSLEQTAIHALLPQLELQSSTGVVKGNWCILTKYEPAVQIRILAYVCHQMIPQVPVSSAQLAAIQQLLAGKSPQGSIDLVDDWQFSKRYQLFEIKPVTVAANDNKQVIRLLPNQWQQLPNGDSIGLFEARNHPTIKGQSVYLTRIQADQLTLRRAKSGDQLAIGHGHHKRIRRLLIDAKWPIEARQQMWLATLNEEVVIAVNLRVSQLFIQDETDKIHYILGTNSSK